jgi:hypothetical protein
MVCHNIEADYTRDAWFHLGGGVVRVGQVSKHTRHDPNGGLWGILMQPPYEEYEVIDLGDDWSELRAKTTPANGAINVLRSKALGWVDQEGAVAYDVYFGTDLSQVSEATRENPLDVLVSADQGTTTYDPVGLLEFDRTYYWRIDVMKEANPDSPQKGEVWSFTVANFDIVDNFESYGNESPDLVYETWFDGFDAQGEGPVGNENGNGTGSILGHDIWTGTSAHYAQTVMETTIVIPDSNQAMPIYYDGSGTARVDLNIDPAQDWTEAGTKITKLIVPFHGTAANTGQLYVMIGDQKISYPGDAADIAKEAWTTWEIDLTSSGAALASVSKLSIGIDGSTTDGLLYIDDVLLKP